MSQRRIMLDTLERDDTKIMVTKTMDKDDLWSEVFGSGWEYMSWWVGAKFLEGDWDKHGQVIMSYLDPDDPTETKALTKRLDIVNIANAYSSLMTLSLIHI
jgi:hypothetical protein